MPGEREMRAVTAAPGEQIVNPGIAGAERKSGTSEPHRGEHGFKQVKRTAFHRRHRRAPQQIPGKRKGK
jgi:hypothetical protein